MPTPTTSGSGLRPRRTAGAASSGLADGGATGRVGPDGNSHVGPVAGGGVAGPALAGGTAPADEMGPAGGMTAGGVTAGPGTGVRAGAVGRAEVAGAACPGTGRRSPHEMQNVRPTGLARPQTGQVGPVVVSDGAAGGTGGGTDAANADAAGAGSWDAGTLPGVGSCLAAATPEAPASSATNSRNAPHPPQNASPAAFWVPHFGQIIPLAFASLGCVSPEA